MPVTDALGNRMKEYENAYRFCLPRRLPVILRIDGRAFHTLTRGFVRPFDDVLHRAMCLTALTLCKEIGGAKFAYTQSDEISLLLTNDDRLDTQPWFNNNLNKLVSLSAATATLAFNKAFRKEFDSWGRSQFDGWDNGGTNNPDANTPEEWKLQAAYNSAVDKAMFDSRAFILPPEEVVNYFIWRQQDAVRNSIQMAAQSMYSHKELQNKNCDQLQEMLFQRGVNWNNYDTWKKRGTCFSLCEVTELVAHGAAVKRHKWVMDINTPLFTPNRGYIESTFMPKEESE